MASARCTQCHRQEDWSWAEGAWTRTVRAAGGARRPSAPERQALEVVLRDGRRLVAACPACGQPMLGDAGSEVELPAIPWRIAVPDGLVTFSADGATTGPTGPLTRREAAALVRAAHPAADADPPSRWTTAFQVGLVLVMLTPVAVWLFSVFFVSFFLSHASEAL